MDNIRYCAAGMPHLLSFEPFVLDKKILKFDNSGK